MKNFVTEFVDQINNLIHAAILEGKTNILTGNMALEYKLDNEFDLVFIVGYQRMLQISYADQFLDSIQRKFRDKYKQLLVKSNCHNLFKYNNRQKSFDNFED